MSYRDLIYMEYNANILEKYYFNVAESSADHFKHGFEVNGALDPESF